MVGGGLFIAAPRKHYGHITPYFGQQRARAKGFRHIRIAPGCAGLVLFAAQR